MWMLIAIVAGLTAGYALLDKPSVAIIWFLIAIFAYSRRRSQPKRESRSRLRGCATLVMLVFVGVIIWAIGYYPSSKTTVSPTAQSVAIQIPTATRTPLPRPTATRISSTKADVVRVAAVATITTSGDILQVTSEGVRLTLKQIEFREGVDGNNASNGMLAVFLGEFRADSSYCVSARDIRLILDDVAYAPDRGWMHAVQGTLEDERNYPGPIGGQCLNPNEDTLTFFVFDVPDDVGDVQLRFVNETVDLSIDWGVTIVNIASATPLPSDTKAPTKTRTEALVLPSNTKLPTQTYTAVASTIAPPTEEWEGKQKELSSAYLDIDGVISADVFVLGNVVHVEAKVNPGYDTLLTVQAMWSLAKQVTENEDIGFSVILDDGSVPTDYVWDPRRKEWRTTRLEIVATARATRSAPIESTSAPLFTPQAGLMTTTEPKTYYVISSANVRACASTDCDIVTRLSAGNAITVDGFINGEIVETGNAIWYHMRYNGREGYVYSNLVSLVRPVTGGSGSGNPLPTGAQNTPAPLVSTPTSSAPIWSCAGDFYNCGDFSNRTDLMNYFNACPGDPSDLDGNENGIPCE